MGDYSILRGQPAFANVAPYAQPEYGLPADVLGVFAASQTLSVRQHVKLLPKACCQCPPCVKQENTYSVYAGLTRNDAAEFLRVDEISDDWNRCCCAPNHPWRLEARSYIPPPGSSASSDWQHLTGDASADFGRFTGAEKAKYLKEGYMKAPVLFSIVRDDGMRCCWCCPRFPMKCLTVCVFCGCCMDGVRVYGGSVVEPEGNELGRVNAQSQTGPMIGAVKQPFCAGGCHPKLDLKNSDSEEPYGAVEGPYCFGGWSELCCDFKFWVSKASSPGKSGDMALIVKRKPSSMAMATTELLSDADNYTIEFDPNNPITPGQKATIMAAQLLADYIYFDGNTEKCAFKDDSIYCYFFYCSIYGCLYPCYIRIPLKG
eukprot:CAMPEP_0182427806 /NCGR_PEP_ID=MMETSP1167-20130531/19862_1 /TAXON_ID=2988 /ORGANISM="Mallomonas Sp, Strain CCMP3275" /LENGTH=372 /DNA_ID=CAMNT_0024610307 /DNA_START=59 /DNA_END=1177 /DNA_ORIENTATION=-